MNSALIASRRKSLVIGASNVVDRRWLLRQNVVRRMQQIVAACRRLVIAIADRRRRRRYWWWLLLVIINNINNIPILGQKYFDFDSYCLSKSRILILISHFNFISFRLLISKCIRCVKNTRLAEDEAKPVPCITW